MCNTCNFNPRSREGSDRDQNLVCICSFLFQSTLPRGERLLRLIYGILLTPISIHAPARGATFSAPPATSFSLLFQSTLPRGERRSFVSWGIFIFPISIHAPARGATGSHPITCLRFKNFNPRSREGSDSIPSLHAGAPKISIHAPARGATIDRNAFGFEIDNFNPRSREGSDLYRVSVHPLLIQFQSTLPRGERPISLQIFRLIKLFQSTLPRGERPTGAYTVLL